LHRNLLFEETIIAAGRMLVWEKLASTSQQ
jgi:hypothetical protein